MTRASEKYFPYGLLSPALLLFIGLLFIPLVLTVILSFYSFNSMSGIIPTFTTHNYKAIFTDPYYIGIFGRTGGMALLVTLLCLLFGIPETIILSRMKSPWRGLCLVLILGPLLVSVVVRTLGWSILMGREGLINDFLVFTGLADSPVRMLYTMTGVVIALVHVLIPFMIISIWASLRKLDPWVENAAQSLGGSSFVVYRRIVIPQLLPGILSGSIIVFALSASAFATPALIGGRRLKVVATAAYDEFLSSLNWPLGAAIALLLLIANLAVIMGANKLIERKYKHIFH
jgi:putative spermidine/putrescine transport system permease protein